MRFEMIRLKKQKVSEGKSSGRNPKDRAVDPREKFGGRSGYIKIDPSRPQTKRPSLGQSGRKSLLPRTDLYGMGLKIPEKDVGCLPERTRMITDHNASTRHDTPDRGIS
jgi:hypothetical protein